MYFIVWNVFQIQYADSNVMAISDKGFIYFRTKPHQTNLYCFFGYVILKYSLNTRFEKRNETTHMHIEVELS